MPLVSAIIPNYNHARYLRKRIDSVLNQTFQDFELILMDDCSTDESREIISEYAGEPRVRSVTNESNSGCVFKQWNKGVAMAKGELIWIAESDDFAETGLLDSLVRLLAEHPEAGIAYCQSRRIGANDEPLGTLADWTADLDGKRWETRYFNSGHDECRRFLLWKNTIPNASAVLFKRAVFLEAGGGPEHMRLCGDWDVWMRMLKISGIAYTPKLLNHYRMHSSSVRETTGAGRFFDEKWAVQRRMVREFQISGKDLERLVRENFEELLCRVGNTRSEERKRESIRGMMAYFPFFLRAPLTAIDCALNRHRKNPTQ